MKKYTISLLSGIVITFICITIFNWLINPFDIFSSPVIKGLNVHKVDIEKYGRLSKAYKVDRIKFDTIILGSSRALEVPEQHNVFGDLNALNLALPSGSTYEKLRMFQHARAIQPVKRVIIGLDERFTDAPLASFVEQRLAVNYDGSANRLRLITYWKDIFSALLSYDAVKASFSTIKKQDNVPDREFLKKYRRQRVKKAGGHRQMSRTAEGGVLVNRVRVDRPSCENAVASEAKKLQVSKYFQRILDLAYQDNIDLYIYYTPVHARYYEAFCIIGDWPKIENTKRAVVLAVEDTAKKYGRQPFHVWDFTGYNSITTESLPEYGDKETLMRWYWESMHATRETNGLVLERMLGTGKNVPEDFGTLMTSDNIEQHLNNIHAERKRYAIANPADVEEVRSLLH